MTRRFPFLKLNRTTGSCDYKIMNAVFLEDQVQWDSETKGPCHHSGVQLHCKAAAYTLLSTWPERDGVSFLKMNGGRREAKGLGLEIGHIGSRKVDDADIYSQGIEERRLVRSRHFLPWSGDIIGATKLDEEILAEMLREEEAGIEDGMKRRAS